METWSYALGSQLRTAFMHIEELRKEILLTPLSPHFVLSLQWETIVRKTHWSLSLSDGKYSEKEIESILTKQKDHLSKEARLVANYKDALDYIASEWLANDHPISIRTIALLHEKLFSGVLEKRALGRFRNESKTIASYQAPPPGHIERTATSLLQNLNQTPNKENPIILAGLVHIQILRILPFLDGNGRIARLLALLVLYKFGYDIKGFICLEQGYRKDLKTYYRIVDMSLESGNLTPWLEFFVQNFITELEGVVEKLKVKRTISIENSSFARLSDRQKAILNMVQKPGENISNKLVQKRFRVSQITAARDLGKLKTLGLFISLGKGRSTSYRRI